MSFFSRRAVTEPLSILLIIISLSQLFGILIDSDVIADFGDATMLAPRPDPMAEVEGYVHFENTGTFTLLTEDLSYIVPFDRDLVEAIGGPHRYSVIYLIGISWAPLLSDHLRDRVIEHSFCGNGILVKNLGIAGPVKNVSLSIENKLTKRTIKFDVKCI